MKFTKKHEKALREFMSKMDANGCVPVDQWTSGRGRYTSNRALPPFVKRYERKAYGDCNKPSHGTPERAAMVFFDANPKRKAVLVLDGKKLEAFAFSCMHLQEF